jgi:hypothetical protein
MRFVGLIDPSSALYNDWRVPNPTAPYPQDYIIDQQGYVQYWSDQFDPWEVIRTIDRLLATGLEENSKPHASRLKLTAIPSVTRSPVSFHLNPGTIDPLNHSLEIRDAAGRLKRRLASPPNSASIVWNLRDELGQRVPPGIYLARAEGPRPAGCRFIVLD